MSSQLKLSAYGALATSATAMSLLTVFNTTAWFIPVMGGIVLVAGTCALVRTSPLPSVFEPIAAAVVVLFWITGLYGRDGAHAVIIPGPGSFRTLGETARSGFTEIHQLPTPAPAHHGLVLLTVVGVAAIALVVDLMTVTLRRAALAGLPLLALFTVCAATGHHGVGLVPFITSAIGYLWLLYADNRDKVSRWGAAIGTGSQARPASAWSTDPLTAPPPASLGRQVGAAAISLGLIVPLMIPGLHTGIGKRGGTSGAPGPGVTRVYNPIVRIGAELTSSQPETVLSYHTTSSNPGYIRMTSLDRFDGFAFTQGNLTAGPGQAASNQLPVTAPPGATVQTDFSIDGDFVVHWLPVESTALGVSLGEPWRYDPATSTIFSATETTSGLQYTERSVPDEPTAAELEAAPKPGPALDADLTLPQIAAPVRKLAKQITQGAKSQYAAAVDIQEYLTSSLFTYSTRIPADNSDQALYNFLFNNRRGFCQQFATAMAVLARLRGIPSRVAVGFTAGRREAGGRYVVTTKDAHAWPELWFDGYGWLAFEPTPRGDGQAVTPSYAKPSLGGGKGNHNSNRDKLNKNAVPNDTSPKGKGNQHHSGDTVVAGSGGGSSGPSMSLIWLVIAVAIGLLALPGSARALVRYRRWRLARDPSRAPEIAWAELRDTAIDRNLPWDDRRSPRQVAKTLLYELDATPKITDAMTRLARYEEEARYAPKAHRQTDNLRYDVGVVRTAIDADRGMRKRLRTLVLPRSVTLRLRGLVGNTMSAARSFSHRLSPLTLLRARSG